MKEVQESIENVRRYHVDEVLMVVLEGVYGAIGASGIDDENSDKYRDQGLICEAIRSYLYACYGIHHPLQRFAEENFYEKEFLDDGIAVVDMHPEFVETYGKKEVDEKTA